VQLKRYQADTLTVLRRYLDEAAASSPKDAYEAITREPEQAKRPGQLTRQYVTLGGMPMVPYVCLRLPTGGGKTILGAYAIKVAQEAWIGQDYPVVLWLVPSNTIRLQTVEALKNARHPYRRVLDDDFGGRVRVFDIADFATIRPDDISSNLCVVVGTIQTLRVNNTEGRKVYAHHEDMEAHFSRRKHLLPSLERFDSGPEKGEVKFSFANLLHLHRPLMIVDEAHNAVTGLTREMQARVRPAAVIEFTATPKDRSNILHSVTAQELKQEEMIKLPIVLSEHDTWQNAVNGAIARHAALAVTAKDEPDYLRPIVLFQAQPKDQEVTVEALKRHLIEVEQVPEHKIAVATGEQRELDGIDLFDRACPIEFVITIEALKEGWDCSFAYVFCSVARIQSATDVEQLLGRVLRMPYAKRRQAPELNRAYAFLSEPTFGVAARTLVDKLVDMGFEEDEARDSIEPVQPGLDDDGGLFAARERPRPTFKHVVPATPAVLAALGQQQTHHGLAFRETPGGAVEIVVAGRVDGELENAIAAALSEADREEFTTAVATYRREIQDQLSPAERGEAFVIPRLMAMVQGELEFADTDILMECHDWSVLDHSPRMDELEFAIRETARSFEIDIDGRQVTLQSIGEQEELDLDVEVEGWTPEALVLWLDRQVRQPDIGQGELLRWLRDLVGHLCDRRGLRIPALMRCKFILARKIREKVAGIRRQVREGVYQRHLFAPEARVEVSFDNGFAFRDGMYSDQHRYRGRWRFRKHFLGPDHVPAFDGSEDGEEFQCAQAIDGLPQVRYWTRNVARHPSSFWLPTATDRFYPDFVALLEDGRLLVVEYKGALLADSADTQEKRVIGELWERKSGGKGRFAMVEKELNGKNVRRQLLDKIGAA
jgi:type III restriction enzyme